MPEPTAHVWLVNLAGGDRVTARALATLPAEEVRRLSTTLAPRRRHRLCAQAALRTLAAAFVGSTPLMLRIDRSGDGKPRIDGHRSAHISLAHSGRFAAVALSATGPVGVDVELPRAMPEPAGLARTILSEAEHDRWLALDDRAAAMLMLLRSWTHKEAVLKALGSGLAGDVRAVSTRPGPHGRPELESLPPDAGRPPEWTLRDLHDVCGLPSAVAVAAPDVRIHFHRAAIADLLFGRVHPVGQARYAEAGRGLTP
jgi:4'-phosphopantetheinyl transferase